MSLFITWSYFWSHTSMIVNALYVFTIICIVVLIILENRSPLKTIAWAIVLVLLPVVGIVIYLVFGQSFRKRKMFSRNGFKGIEDQRRLAAVQLKRLQDFPFYSNPQIYEKIPLMRLLLNNGLSIVSDDNEVEVYNNGRDTFNAILRELKKATRHIHIASYIIEDDRIGGEVRDILVEKARAGVNVRLIYDDVGSWRLSKKFTQSLEEAGVSVCCFMKVRFPWLTSKVNFRNHRKIIVIDGKVGFVGGINIADRYIDGVPEIGTWRDTHLCLRGGAVRSLQRIFMTDWYFVKKELLPAKEYLPSIRRGGKCVVQIVASAPDFDWETIAQAYFYVIATAKKQVLLATPYFMPTSEILNAIKIAALSGVDVRLLIPEKADSIISKWCTESYVEELLDAGVRVFQYQSGFTHSKLVIVDGIVASVGTANLDFRSLETNFEVNAFIFDAKITSELVLQFMHDLDLSCEVTHESWSLRSWSQRLRASLARLFSPLM